MCVATLNSHQSDVEQRLGRTVQSCPSRGPPRQTSPGRRAPCRGRRHQSVDVPAATTLDAMKALSKVAREIVLDVPRDETHHIVLGRRSEGIEPDYVPHQHLPHHLRCHQVSAHPAWKVAASPCGTSGSGSRHTDVTPTLWTSKRSSMLCIRSQNPTCSCWVWRWKNFATAETRRPTCRQLQGKGQLLRRSFLRPWTIRRDF